MATIEVSNMVGDFDIKLDESKGRFTVTIDSYKGDSKEVIVPDNIGGIPVTVIGVLAFFGCENLTNLILPEGLVTIQWCAFEDCEKLINITIPKDTVHIEEDAFDNCNSLKEFIVDEQNRYFTSHDGVLFDKNMTTLIFYPQAKEGNYTIPDSVNTITSYAFAKGCRGLTGISFPKDLINFHSFAKCERLSSFTVNENSKDYISIDGVLLTKNKEGKEQRLMCYPQGRDSTNYIVPHNVSEIGYEAFYNCKHLRSIILPEGLEFIGEEAFYGCEQLTAMALPMSLEYIGKGAFYGCEKLTAMTLPMSLEYIDEGIFRECPNLETITLSRKTKTNYKAFKGFSGKIIYRD